jgi:ChrR Cupin-like domain
MAKMLVIEIVIQDEYNKYQNGSWLRSPHFSHHPPFTVI